MSDISYIQDPTAWGDALAEQMREYYEENKSIRWKQGQADSLMIGLSNIVSRAISERDKATKPAEKPVVSETKSKVTRETQINAMWRAHRRWLNPAFVSDEDIPHSRQDLWAFYGNLLDAIPDLQPERDGEDAKPRVGYDPMGDVLYVSFPGAPRSAVSVERYASVLWRFDEKGQVVGVTILDAKHQATTTRTPVDTSELRKRIAVALINENNRFGNMGVPRITSLDGMEEHLYRDQLRYADVILQLLEHDSQTFASVIKREGYRDEVFREMCSYVKYAITAIEDTPASREEIIESAVDRILRTATLNSTYSDKEVRLRTLISERLLFKYRTSDKAELATVIDSKIDRSGNLLGWLRRLNEEVRQPASVEKDSQHESDILTQLRKLATKQEGVGHSYTRGGPGRGISSINLYGDRADSAIWLFQNASRIADFFEVRLIKEGKQQ